MRPLEIAVCVVTGHDGTLALRRAVSATRAGRSSSSCSRRCDAHPAASPSRVDASSAVLAVAVHVARREGLAEPIPITKVFPDVPTTEEQSWQERHRALGSTIGNASSSTTSSTCSARSPPPTSSTTASCGRRRSTATTRSRSCSWRIADRRRGRRRGAGGHGAPHRPDDDVVRSPRSVTPVRLRRAAVTLLPKRLRARRVRDRWSADPLPWLRRRLAAALAGGRRRRGRGAIVVRREPDPDPPPARPGARRPNREYFARARNVELSSPLLHPDVVHTLAAQGGFFGVGSRTATARRPCRTCCPTTC